MVNVTIKSIIKWIIGILIMLTFLSVIFILVSQNYMNLISFSAFLNRNSLILMMLRLSVYTFILVFWIKIKKPLKEKSTMQYEKLKRLLVFSAVVVLISEISLFIRLGIISW